MSFKLKDKMKFFSLYWDQKVIRQPLDTTIYIVNGENLSTKQDFEFIENGWLELKDLNKMSKDEINCIVNLEGDEDDFSRCGIYESYKEELRSLGYAVEFNELSVSKLIEIGWVKLKI